MLKQIIATTALITIASTANAYTGNDLLSRCESDDSFERNACLWYVVGAAQGGTIEAIWETGDKNRYCVPDNVTFGQLEAIAIKYLREHPEELHLNASSLVLNSMSTAFCE